MNWNWGMSAIAVAVLAGCQPTPVAPVAPSPATVSTSPEVLLKSQPADAQPVGDARKSAKDGAAVTILGRIGGDTNPWVEGRAAFTIVDPKLQPCQPGCRRLQRHAG